MQERTMDEKSLGARLQKARQAAGFTQQMLCHKANLSYSTLTKIERGAIKSPSIFTIQNIADALNVGLDELMGLASSVKHKPRWRSKTGVTFVFFDINGCLVRFYHRAFTRLAHDTGASPDTVETVFWRYNDLVCRGDITIEEFNQKLTEKLKASKPISWLDYYLYAIEPIKSMHQMVRSIAENYGVGLLTNIMPGSVDLMFQKSLLPDVNFDTVVDSSVVKAIKPEAKIYEIATQKANCPASDILLIDDSRVNLMAAEKHGWHVMWFDYYRPEESIERIKTALKPDDGQS